MAPANLSIRPPVESDAPRLAVIHIAAWRAAYRGVMSDDYLDGLDVGRHSDGWRRNILNPRNGTVHLVAQVDDELVGFAIVGPGDNTSDPSVGQLNAINLHPDWWAQGIGTVLFAAAEETLVLLGYQAGFLWVEAGNDRAISFYTKRGWLDDGGTMEDARFDPPVVERRHSRSWKGEPHWEGR
ncbi:GNAT family N-acetyltransferase [Arthrobacter jiangjiafuii]|uniref:GNAT family N-acetyltransferase n=2 Tax=Arthrobacter jiangjiafuii TaxID=2817475 RepID=A0A975M7K6_9MICC|nr:GNAT family N-acetyltransferase [Arthrobacter jiangjiafuii]QWC11377.1 GNAT family N-acetyltransferase [Arthrobacter jiangjiafuii]